MKARKSHREDLLAVVAHELRGPLSSIIGWAQLLEQGELRSHQSRRAVEIIRRSAMTQAQLIDDLLDQDCIARGNLRITREPVDVLDLAMEVVDAMKLTAEERDIELVVQGETPAPICADPGRLRQVLRNLLANALHYSPRRSQVQLRVVSEDDRIVVSVHDSGIGIAPAFLPFVFERFRREGRSRASGLGLGLAIAREIVELHGGSIKAESAGEGHGSTFTVSLPRFAEACALQKSA
jgi:signal transduction histidine kinase